MLSEWLTSLTISRRAQGSVTRVWCFPGTSHVAGFTVDLETQLRSQLLTNYSTSVRPSQITLIELSFNLLSINFVVSLA